MRPSLLDDDRLQLIRRAVRLGLSNREAAAASGVAENTWHRWKTRAKSLSSLLDTPAEKHSLKSLRGFSETLGINLSKLKGTGSRGRVLKVDIARAVEERSRLILEFWKELEAAKPYRKAHLLESLDRLVKGGQVVTEIRDGRVIRRGIKKTRKITGYELRTIETDDKKTIQKWVPVKKIEMEEEKELPPDRQAAIKMLESGWPEEFGRRKPIEVDDGGTAQESAKELVSAAHQMFATIPGPPLGSESNDGVVGAVVREVSRMSDEEVEAALENMDA